jgi:hypothetical protein
MHHRSNLYLHINFLAPSSLNQKFVPSLKKNKKSAFFFVLFFFFFFEALAIEKSRMKLETICEAHMKKLEQNGNQLKQTMKNYSESTTSSSNVTTGMTFFFSSDIES